MGDTLVENIERQFIDAREDFQVYHELIYKHLKPSDEEKKNNAEIPTPPSLIREMLDKVPSDFWSKPNKVLDPCCGKGGFVVELFRRFDEGFKLEYPKLSEIKRRKFIIENIIHFWDISPLNVFLTQEILRVMSGGATTEYNSWVGDSLTKSTNKKFSLVVGNPPYEARSDSGVSKGGGNNLYTKFVYLADHLLNDNGYMLFITPPSYFSPGRSINKNDMNLRKDIFDKYYQYYINLEECAKHINVTSNLIYLLIQKSNNQNEDVQVVCKYKNTIYNTNIHQRLLIRPYLPYLLTNESLQIMTKVKNIKSDKLAIFNSTFFDKRRPHVLSKNKNESVEEYKQRALDNGYVYPIQATSVQVVYSSKKCKNQDDKKVLMSESGYLKPFYDDGILGVGGHCFACLVKDVNEGNKIIQLINSKLYKFYIETNKWSGFHNREVLQDSSNIIYELDEINDDNIYKYFDITSEDIILINSAVK